MDVVENMDEDIIWTTAHDRQLTSAELTADTEGHVFKGIILTETYFDSESGDALNPRGPTTVIEA